MLTACWQSLIWDCARDRLLRHGDVPILSLACHGASSHLPGAARLAVPAKDGSALPESCRAAGSSRYPGPHQAQAVGEPGGPEVSKVQGEVTGTQEGDLGYIVIHSNWRLSTS